MKKKDLQKLKEGIEAVATLKNAKFSYVLFKNKKLIENEIEVLKEIDKPIEAFQKFEYDRVVLCEKYCERKEDGQPLLIDNTYKIKDVENFNKDIVELRNANLESIEAEQKRLEDFNKLLEEDLNIEFLKIKSDDLPNDISLEQLSGIEDFLE